MTAIRGPTTKPEALRRTAAGRALAVLDAFGPGSRTLTLSEIARRAGLTLPTTHRLVGELVSWGALERHLSGRYFVGLRLLELAALAPRGLALREAAYPYLDDLHQATRANVHLGVRDGREVVYVETMRSRVSTQISSRVGDRWPLHATGTGLVLLAYADKELQDMVLQAPLVRYSPKTIVDPRELRRVLADVRQTGVVITRQQISMDALAVAVPVRGPYEKVVAAISVVVGLHETVPQRLVAMLLETAHSISCALSVSPDPGHAGAPALPIRATDRQVALTITGSTAPAAAAAGSRRPRD